jgi:uncharacterized protein (DUF433 family)
MILDGHLRIAIDPAICGGRPTVAGTRVQDFPYFSIEDIRACLAYAAGTCN